MYHNRKIIAHNKAGAGRPLTAALWQTYFGDSIHSKQTVPPPRGVGVACHLTLQETMTYAIEVYSATEDRVADDAVEAAIIALGGRTDYREPAGVIGDSRYVTFEFDSAAVSEAAAKLARERGRHVEGPFSYG